MRIPSGKTDQVIYFVAVDVTDLKTREVGLTGFTVYRSRNGGAATAYTTPTVTELSAANMPGVYACLLDEDTTIAASSDSEEYVVHITQAAMAPVTRTIELYRREVTTGNTLNVSAAGRALSDLDTIKTQTVTCAGGVTVPAATLASTTNITAASGITLANGAQTITTLTCTGGITVTQSNANTPGLSITGNGTGAGILSTSGSGATGDGIRAVAASTNGHGITGAKTGTGNDLNCTSTPLTLAKTTNITGFNDIAATAVVSSGAITTSGGAVSTVTNVTTVNGLAANTITATSIAADAITAAKIATGAIDADALATDAVTKMRSIVSGTADSGTTTTMVDAARTEADTDYWKDAAILFTSGTIAGQSRLITGFNPATDTITFSPATTQAVGTNTYEIISNVATAGASAPTAAEIADAVWDEDATAHQTQGTFGQAIGDPAADTNSIYKAVVTDATGATVGVDVVAVKSETASIQSDTNDIQTRLPAALVSGRMDSSVGAIAANAITAASIAADAITDAKVAADVTIASVTGTVGSVTGAVTVGTINANAITATSIAADAITAAKIATGAIDADALAPDAAAELADAVWDEALSGHTTVGSAGKALSDAGASGDPWATAVPGAYGSGTAGNILGNNLNVTVASRASQASVDTVDTVVGAILVDTAEIGVAGAGLTNINLPNQTMDIVGNITGNLIGSVGSVTARVTANVDQLNGDAAAAATLAVLNGANVVYRGTVTGAATTTTLIDSGLTQADADWWKGRIIIFTSVIPMQATDITAFDPATDKLTFTAVTQAPTGASYVII